MTNSLNIKLGIAAGLINCIAWYIFSRILTYYEVALIDRYRLITTLILLLTGSFICIFTQRKSNGSIEFKTAFKTAFLYVLILAAFLGAFNYIYYSFIAPDAIEFYISDAKKQVMNHSTKIEDLPKFEEAVRAYFSSFKMFMSTIIIGIIVSLILSGLLHKKPKHIPFSEN